MIKILGLTVAAVTMSGILFMTSRGPDPRSVPTVGAVLSRTMSPFCPGLTLDECPSTQAVEVRDELARMVEQGRTNEQIDAWLVANFGEGVLGRPPGMAGWALPATILLIGAGVVATVLFRRPTEHGSEALAEEDLNRLEQDLAGYEAGNE